MTYFQRDELAKRRIIWNLNHTTLMEWEVPQLISMGFEVFIPKILPAGPSGRTAIVTDKYDNTLSIPKLELDILNNTDFYDNPFPDNAVAIINRRFASAICATIYPSLLFYTEQYTGTIFMRAFGHAGDHDYESATDTINFAQISNYTSFCHLDMDDQEILPQTDRLAHQNRATAALQRIRHRCYLSASYREIISHEKSFLRSRSLYMPLALPPSILQHENTWTGESKHVLFVCPNIAQIGYYRAIYDQFKSCLGEFPHVIAGRQSLKGDKVEASIEDTSVTGYLTRDELNEYLRRSACMFYHSQEKRHLHYHPLEAITFGMPLVYMAGGLLQSLGGDEQPGLCFSYEEARQKISQILDGDEDFIQRIKFKQNQILDEFMPEYCDKVWRANFLPLVSSEGKIEKGRKSLIRILVFNPTYVLGGGINVIQNLLNHLSRQCLNGFIFKVTLAIPTKYREEGFDFRCFSSEINIVFVEELDLDATQQMFDIAYFSWPHGVILPKLDIPAIALYHDCIVLDKAQSANDDWLEEQAIREIRKVASSVDKMFVTSQYTRSRLACILEHEHHAKLCVIPHMASNESHPSRKAVEPLPCLPDNYLYYPANLSPHKGHDKLLKAFSRIMQSDDFIPLVFTGYETDILQDLEKCASHENHYINELANIIINSGMVHGKHYYSLGYLADNEIQAVFRFCSALVTVSSAEGMGLPVHEAIELGKPILLSDIEVFREHYSGRIGLPFWVNPLSEASIHKGLCDLCYVLNNYPGRHSPGKPTPHTWDDIAKCTAIHIQECLGLA